MKQSQEKNIVKLYLNCFQLPYLCNVVDGQYLYLHAMSVPFFALVDVFVL